MLAPLVLAVVQLTSAIVPDAPSVQTGGTAGFTAQIRNTGTEAVGGISVSLQVDAGRLIAPAGCTQSSERIVGCGVSTAAGETKSIHFTAQAGNDASVTRMTAGVGLIAIIPSDQPIEHGSSTSITVTPSPTAVDLALRFDPDPPTRPLGTVERTLTVTNRGPAPASDITITLGNAQTYSTRTIAHLNAGESSTIALRFDVTVAQQIAIAARAYVPNATDPNPADNTATAVTNFGIASDFTRILLPIFVNQAPGSRAFWISQAAAYARTPATVRYVERDVHLRQFADGLFPFTSPGYPHGILLYVERTLAPEVSFSARLHSSAAGPARAVELPVVRESAFRERVIIPSVVLDATHRFLLRVYDPNATPNAVVRVRVFRDDPGFPLTERTLPLVTMPGSVGELGPAFPGYAETSDVFPAEGFVGVEVTGVTPGLRLWAFVSATESPGEHVTLVSPQ